MGIKLSERSGRRVLLSTLTALLVGLGGIAAAEAIIVTEHPCGGTWRYESNVPSGKQVFSSYQNRRTVHKSSVINGNGVYKASGWKNAGTLAFSSLPGTDKVDRAYYANKDPKTFCK